MKSLDLVLLESDFNNELTHEIFDLLYDGVIDVDIMAIKQLVDKVYPCVYKYVIRKYGKNITITEDEIESKIYHIVSKYVKSLAKKGNKKDYNTFFNQLKNLVNREIEKIINVKTSTIYAVAGCYRLFDLQNSNDVVMTAILTKINSLDKQTKIVVELHLGIIDGERKNFTQIGKILGIGRNRAYQLYARAVCKIDTSKPDFEIDNASINNDV